ncbi:MAG: SpoIIE family protein phosphatase [Desulfobacteraceae bacterium]|nr:SpoIIE family protein phosphatase [Desulfobacteraceae bacterium]MBC2750854.1 SpoIIE family protein phosphatase [Desulfobacteraceae bacterium]
MIIAKDAALKIIATWLLFALLTSQLFSFLLPDLSNTLNDRGIDHIQRLLYAAQELRPDYQDVIVHVDLNNHSLKSLKNRHPDRTDHAQLIRNLSAMGTSLQMLDFVYAGTTANSADRALVDAVRETDAVAVGMALRIAGSGTVLSGFSDQGESRAPVVPLREAGSAAVNFYRGCTDLLLPFEALASSAAAVGYLTLVPDNDGVFRRLPLLVRCGEGFYPSFTLAAVSRYLGVPPDKIAIEPGQIRLVDALFPGEDRPRELVVPVDAAGRLRIQYVGPWGRMRHYAFADIFLASRDQDAMAIWREELSGKIVLVSDITTGAADVGPIPLDLHFPLSGVHANAVHTILTESFLTASPWPVLLLINAVMLAGMLFFALRFSAIAFTLTTLVMTALYLVATTVFLYASGVMLPLIQPMAMVVIGMFTVHIASSVANARTHAMTETARQLAERDLDIGRSIQSSFLPTNRVCPPGWQVATHFKPARQVSGDFYDLFELGGGRYVAVVVADVCDKGVGAALFMALIRSLIRAFAIQDFNQYCDLRDNPEGCSDTAVLNAITQTNRYLADTHADTGMFATLFIGILEHGTGHLRYVNCGHEPPLVIGHRRVMNRLKPTGPALGLMIDSVFAIGDLTLKRGETILAFTDGLTESESSTGEAFGRQRLSELVGCGEGGAQRLVDRIVHAKANHTSGQTPFDDITIVAVQRENRSNGTAVQVK